MTTHDWKPRIANVLTNIILLVIDEIPAVSEVVVQILNTSTTKADGDVGPTHSRTLRTIEFVLERMRNIVEVHDSRVVEILSRKNNLVEVRRMSI